MKDIFQTLESRLAENKDHYSKLPRYAGKTAIKLNDEILLTINISEGTISRGHTENPDSYIRFASDSVLTEFLESPSRAWSLAGQKLIQFSDRFGAIHLLESLFPGALQKALTKSRFRLMFPNLIVESNATTTEEFFESKAPQLLKENIHILRTVTASFEFHIEDAGIWTVDASANGEVYSGESKSKRNHTLKTTRSIFEEILEDETKAWRYFNSGVIEVSNACRASQIVRTLFPTALVKAMPAALYQSLYPETLRDAGACEYNRTQGVYTTYILGKKNHYAPLQYSRKGDLAIYQGDIILGTVKEMEEIRKQVEGTSGPMPEGFRIIDWSDPTKYLWPNGVVVYEVEGGAEPDKDVKDAMDHWTEKTKITFKKRDSEDNYVYVQSGDGCSSNVGMIGGKQTITLSKNCSTGNIIHEIGHTIGLFHEHTRQDRDEYVTIEWDQIEDGKASQFQIPSSTISDDVGGYDFSSIMHYGKDAFAKGKDATIVPREDVEIGQRDGLSQLDIASVEDMYGPKPSLEEDKKEELVYS